MLTLLANSAQHLEHPAAARGNRQIHCVPQSAAAPRRLHGPHDHWRLQLRLGRHRGPVRATRAPDGRGWALRAGAAWPLQDCIRRVATRRSCYWWWPQAWRRATLCKAQQPAAGVSGAQGMLACIATVGACSLSHSVCCCRGAPAVVLPNCCCLRHRANPYWQCRGWLGVSSSCTHACCRLYVLDASSCSVQSCTSRRHCTHG